MPKLIYNFKQFTQGIENALWIAPAMGFAYGLLSGGLEKLTGQHSGNPVELALILGLVYSVIGFMILLFLAFPISAILHARGIENRFLYGALVAVFAGVAAYLIFEERDPKAITWLALTGAFIGASLSNSYLAIQQEGEQ